MRGRIGEERCADEGAMCAGVGVGGGGEADEPAGEGVRTAAGAGADVGSGGSLRGTFSSAAG